MAQWWSDVHGRTLFQTLGIVLSGWAIGRLVYLILHIVQKKITSKTETDLDDRLIDVAARFSKQIFTVGGFYVATVHLAKVYTGAWSQVADGIFFVIVVLLMAVLISGMTKAVMEWYVASVAVRTETEMDQEIVPLVRRLLNAALFSIAAIICLDHFDIDIQALVVSLGVGSFAIAFAAQETLANMIAGFVIMVDRPFRIGDRIRITSTQQVGDVQQIGLRSTRLLDFDHNLVVIPNAEIIKNDIINYSFPNSGMRLKVDVGVAYDTDLRAAKDILVRVVKSFPQVLPDPEPEAFVLGFGDSSIDLTVIGRVADYKDWFATTDAVRMAIIDEFRTARIEIPFPQRVIHTASDGD